MKNPLLPALVLLLCFISVRAAVGPTEKPAPDARLIDAVTASDAERTAAIMAGDRTRLDAILSDELHYAHSNGIVDDKDSLISTLTSRKIVYERFEYQQREFLPAGPGVMLMSGRVLIHAINDGKKIEVDLNFLSVWREENGRWRFLAWQSCTNPSPSPAATK